MSLGDTLRGTLGAALSHGDTHTRGYTRTPTWCTPTPLHSPIHSGSHLVQHCRSVTHSEEHLVQHCHTVTLTLGIHSDSHLVHPNPLTLPDTLGLPLGAALSHGDTHTRGYTRTCTWCALKPSHPGIHSNLQLAQHCRSVTHSEEHLVQHCHTVTRTLGDTLGLALGAPQHPHTPGCTPARTWCSIVTQ